MKKLVALVALAVVAGVAQASPAVDQFSRCIADNSTGKDRKTLARWLFVSMGAHPEMRAIAAIPPAAAVDASQAAGELFTRLLADACPSQTKGAIQAVGPVAIQQAFTVLGQLAMQELMTDKDVAAGMAALEQYLDRAKLEPVLKAK